MSEIWDKIYNPEALECKVLKDLFDFEFVFLPHKNYEPQEFIKEVTKLRERFDRRAG